VNKNIFSLICAVVTSILWGSAFIAQDMGMDFIGPYTFTSGRMFLGFLTLLPFFFFFEFKKIRKSNFLINKILVYILFLGLMLAGGNIFQQMSLLYTDVANSAIFTIFYVIIVPIISYFLFSKSIHWSIWPAVVMCLVGGLLLSELDNLSVRLGDSLVIVGAFFWAFHIVFISKLLKLFNFPLTIATFQCLFGALFCLIPSLTFESITFANLLMESKELFYAGVLSSGVAFLLQVYSQQNLPPAPVAIIFSLEGVFAAIFGWIILDQYLSDLKVLGIIIILLAVISSQLVPIYGKKKHG
jgi:drug/metabolite transporter (DMT)-like permease